MKSTKDLRATSKPEDSLRKAAKLEPIKKSGKERHQMLEELDDDDVELETYKKRESILDYFEDDEEEDR